MSPTILIFITFLTVSFVLFMRPRRFYFVRHGETLLNAAHVKQGSEGELSELGKRQAEKIGALFAPLSIKKIISSPYERARETSKIISKNIGVSIVYTSLLSERRNPSAIVGKNVHDPEVARAIDQMDLAYHDDDYRYADEESFQDLKVRAKKCLRYLARKGSTQNCVITHHAFLKMLLSYMLHREALHSPDFIKLSFFNAADNGGISVCEFHPWKFFSKTHGWEIVSYNEQPE